MKNYFVFFFTFSFTLSVFAQREIALDCTKRGLAGDVKAGEQIQLKPSKGCCPNPAIALKDDKDVEINNTTGLFTVPENIQRITVLVKCEGADAIRFVLQLKEGGGGNGTGKTGEPNPTEKLEKRQPVVDAKLLDGLWSKQDFGTAKELLKKYGIEAADSTTIEYLKGYKMIWDDKAPKAQGGILENPTEPQGGISDALPSATMVIDALAKFAVKRFKEELMIAYLDSLKLTINGSKEMKLLLPGVHRVVQEQDFFNYPVFLQSLRENGLSDINDFPLNMKEYIKDRKDSTLKNKIEYPILMSSCDLVESLRKNVPAAETIERLSVEDYIAEGNDDYSNIVRGLGAFSRTLRAEENAQTASGWAKTDDVSYILTHKHAFNFWMILLLKLEEENLKKVKVDTTNLYAYLNDDFTKVNEVKDLLYQVNAVSSMAKKWAGAKDSVAYKVHGEFIVAMTDLIGSGLEIFGKNTAELNNYLKLISAVGKLETSIRLKEYGVAISNVVELVSRIEALDGSKTPSWAKHFSEYANFLATLIKAKGGDELEAVLENAALPVQSYRLKRQSGEFNMSINMYPGAAIGAEFFVEELKDSDGKEIKPGFLIAPTVPVGIGFNWGVCKGHSFSVFFPVIDIGAVAALRIQDSVSKLPEL
jgi:hypothetical protein